MSSEQSYSYILIVTCALTRYTLYIPTASCTGEVTLQALVGRCFSVFGHEHAAADEDEH